MKKVLSLILAFVLCLILCACVSSADKENMIAQAKDYVTGNAYRSVINSSGNKLTTTFYFAKDGKVEWFEAIKNDKRDDTIECNITEVSYRVESADEVFIDFVTSNNTHKTIKVVFEEGQADGVMLQYSGSFYAATRYTNAYLSGE